MFNSIIYYQTFLQCDFSFYNYSKSRYVYITFFFNFIYICIFEFYYLYVCPFMAIGNTSLMLLSINNLWSFWTRCIVQRWCTHDFALRNSKHFLMLLLVANVLQGMIRISHLDYSYELKTWKKLNCPTNYVGLCIRPAILLYYIVNLLTSTIVAYLILLI